MYLLMIRYPAECKRDWDLAEQAHRSKGIGAESAETKGSDDGRSVGVEGTLGSVIGHGDENMGPHAPVGKLGFRSAWIKHQTKKRV